MTRSPRLALCILVATLAWPVFAQQAPEIPARETPRAAHDHYAPGALAQAALIHMRAGDLGTACVLIWRAHALAPRDPQVAHAAAEFAARLSGTFTGSIPAPVAPAATRAPASAAPTTPPPPEPPPAWPLRPR